MWEALKETFSCLQLALHCLWLAPPLSQNLQLELVECSLLQQWLLSLQSKVHAFIIGRFHDFRTITLLITIVLIKHKPFANNYNYTEIWKNNIRFSVCQLTAVRNGRLLTWIISQLLFKTSKHGCVFVKNVVKITWLQVFCYFKADWTG